MIKKMMLVTVFFALNALAAVQPKGAVHGGQIGHATKGKQSLAIQYADGDEKSHKWLVLRDGTKTPLYASVTTEKTTPGRTGKTLLTAHGIKMQDNHPIAQVLEVDLTPRIGANDKVVGYRITTATLNQIDLKNLKGVEMNATIEAQTAE